MKRDAVPVSLLLSRSGPYAALGREAVDGAMAAISEVNADNALPFRLEPVLSDPCGVAERYGSMAEAALKAGPCRHVVGTITSWARKEVIPVVERHDALLWYAFPYEGYESCDHVLYFGACPNQHLLPLFDYVLPRYGKRAFLVGSNYIWGWEINRIAREWTEAAGGEVLGERYVTLGSVDVDHLIGKIRETRPDFVLSNLVGHSARAFIDAYHALGVEDPAFAPASCPIVSCNLTETDVADLGEAGEGLITASIYFDGLDTTENHAFKARIAARHGPARQVSSIYVSAYTTVLVLAQAMAEAGTDDPATVLGVVTGRRFDTPFGPLSIDPRTHHAALRPYLGRVTRQGVFEILNSAPTAIAADPYLLHSAPAVIHGGHDGTAAPDPSGAPRMKVVK